MEKESSDKNKSDGRIKLKGKKQRDREKNNWEQDFSMHRQTDWLRKGKKYISRCRDSINCISKYLKADFKGWLPKKRDFKDFVFFLFCTHFHQWTAFERICHKNVPILRE